MVTEKKKTMIGRAEKVLFPELSDMLLHARIDTGARTSTIWGKAVINKNDQLEVTFVGDKNLVHTFSDYGHRVVATSTGHTEARFTIKLLVVLAGRKVRATFTIANRSSQVYPVLIGRNVLKGKFIIDVDMGTVLKAAEKKRIKSLESLLEEKES